MSQDRFFENFPTINYANTTAVDITKRITLLDIVSSNPYIYYPYEITEHERADQFSNRYYEDPFKSWILYISNKIIDPYYEWYLSEEEFQKFIVKKYGSIDNSFKIKYYRDAYENFDNITISGYDALTALLKEYWEPIFLPTGKIAQYKRKQRNLSSTTNKIISYSVSNTNFIKDEICDIVFSNNKKGQGQVAGITDGIIRIQHVSGYYLPIENVVITNTSHIYGRESQTNTIFTSANLTVSNLKPEEEIYWKPVTYFDYEKEKNEFNKTIRVLDKGLAPNIVKNLTDLMKV